MKDSFNNIEDLFKQGFENFEGNVDPSLWANVQQGITVGKGAVAAKSGLSGFMKSVIIGGSIVAAGGAVVVYSTYFSDEETELVSQEVIEDNSVQQTEENTIIVTTEVNDPEIESNKSTIENELLTNQNKAPEVDETRILSNPSTPAGPNNNSTTNQDNTIVSGSNIETNTNHNSNPTVTNETVVETSSVAPEKLYPTGKLEMSAATAFVGEEVMFIANAKNFTSVTWDVAGSVLKGNSVKHTFSQPGKYMVRLKVAGQGEVYEESREIVVKSKSSIDKVPNVFTPNGDRINDEFSIQSTEIKTFYIAIADRNGNIIFESEDVNFKWDGTDPSGAKVEKGMYTYTIIAEGTDGAVFKMPGQIYVQ